MGKGTLAGHGAPTTAREWDLQPYGAFTLFFRWRKKSVQKKASGTATTGKSPLLPIFERGSSQCRAQHCWRDNTYIRARSCSLLSSFKKGKAFSLRCLSPLCSPEVGVGHTYLLWLERVLATWLFCHTKKGGLCFPTVDGGQAYPLRGGILSWQQRPACVLLHAGLFSEP